MEQDNKFIRSLVQSAQSGKIVALEELYKMNLNRIYAIALRVTADKPLAGLLTQTTLIDAWQQLARVRAEVPFADWLKSMIIYDVLGELREGTLQKDKKALKLFKGDGKSDKHLHDPLEKAITELSGNQRLVVVLNLIEDYSTSEIADLLSLSEKKTNELLNDAIKKISKSVPDNEPGGNIIDLIKNLPKEIEPNVDIIPHALEVIREIKIEEFKEVESAIEQEKQLQEQEKEEEKKIEKEEEEKKKEKEKEKKPEKPKRKSNKKIIWVVLLIVAIAAVIIYLKATTKTWNISEHSGTYLINNKTASEPELSSEDIVSTEASSTVTINIPDVGNTRLLQNTTLKRLDEKNTAQLISGDLDIKNAGALENFKLVIPSATIEDFYTGNNYTVSTDEEGNSLIKLSVGWLRIYNKNLEESIFPQSFEVKVSKEQGLGLPYSSESDSAYIAHLEEYLFNGKSLNVLGIVLSNSTSRDAITLWNLLKRVEDEMQRNQVYTWLAKLVPPPSTVNKDGILNLDPEMMQAWLDEIDWKR